MVWRYTGFSLLSIVFLVLLLAAECPAGDVSIAQITKIHGKVMINRSGLSQAIAAEKGSEIQVGDEVVTSEGASAQVAFSDETFINLAPISSIRVNQYSFDSLENRRTARVRVITGTARFVAFRPRADSLLYVESGSAAVRASSRVDFTLSLARKDATVAALDGNVRVKNVSALVVGTVSLGVNQRTVVREKQPPSQPGVITPIERKQYAIIVR